ncbi:MAG: hypothetical protein ACKOWF_17700 [Chloroflexota bacterium]
MNDRIERASLELAGSAPRRGMLLKAAALAVGLGGAGIAALDVEAGNRHCRNRCERHCGEGKTNKQCRRDCKRRCD